jgi:hypothetical protein
MQPSKKGYRAGAFNPDSPSERLKDKGVGIVNSKIGLLGTGYYFVGNLQDVLDLKKEAKYRRISEIDLTKYKLYRPSDPTGFYEAIKETTYYLHQLKEEDLDDPEVKENIKDAVDAFSDELNLNNKEVANIFDNYIKDIISRKDGDLLSNRLLYKYDGIDMTGTPYDDFGAGSLIFSGKLKPGTYKIIQSDIDNINEIGEGTTPYPYSKIKNIDLGKNNIYEFGFKTNSDLNYIARFTYNKQQKTLEVSFYTTSKEKDNDVKYITTNKGVKEAFRIISTIKQIIEKEIMPQNDVKYIRFESAAGKAKEDDSKKGAEQRINLYTAFIKKAFPEATINQLGGVTIASLNENANYSSHIDYKKQILDLTKYFLKQHPHVKSLPKVIFKHNNTENAKNFFGKTAYYNPETKTIIIYTEGRHPKDLTRSFAHELIHFLQDVEGRLHNIQTTNTNEDNDLNKLEKEAYLKGNIIFRNWSDSIN